MEEKPLTNDQFKEINVALVELKNEIRSFVKADTK